MTNKEIKAWWEGVATTSSGRILIPQVEGEADIATFTMVRPDIRAETDAEVHASWSDAGTWRTNIRLANGKIYKIVKVMTMDDGRIDSIMLEYNKERRLIRCYYDEPVMDSQGCDCYYLNRVGACVVEDILYAGIQRNVKLQTKQYKPRYDDKGRIDVVKADDEYDGLDRVEIETSKTLIPENIKKGVDIFGVIGTSAGGGAGLTQIDFTAEDGSLTAIDDEGKVKTVIAQKDEAGLITSVDVDGDILEAEYDEDGVLVGFNGIVINDLPVVTLPEDGNIKRW